MAGDFLAATALVLALQSRGAGSVAVAAVLLASTAPLVVLGPMTGRLADRVDSRTLLVAVGLVQAVVCAVLAHSTDPVAIVGLTAVLAAGLAVSRPTLGALVPDMVGLANVPRAMAISQSANYVGVLIGPALAGVLVGQFGLRIPLLIDAATYLALVVAALAIRTRRGGRPTVATDGATAETPEWRLRGDALLAAVVLGVAVTIGAVSAVNVADVFFVRETLHSSTTVYGLLFAVFTGAMLVGSWLAARVVRERADGPAAALLVGSLGATSAVLLAASGIPHVAWLVPLWIVGGVLNGAENVFAGVLIARRVPAAVRGRALGAFTSAVNGANVVGFLAGGALLTVLSPRLVFALAGLAGLLVAAVCVVPVRRAARRETAPEPAADPEPQLVG